MRVSQASYSHEFGVFPVSGMPAELNVDALITTSEECAAELIVRDALRDGLRTRTWVVLDDRPGQCRAVLLDLIRRRIADELILTLRPPGMGNAYHLLRDGRLRVVITVISTEPGDSRRLAGLVPIGALVPNLDRIAKNHREVLEALRQRLERGLRFHARPEPGHPEGWDGKPRTKVWMGGLNKGPHAGRGDALEWASIDVADGLSTTVRAHSDRRGQIVIDSIEHEDIEGQRVSNTSKLRERAERELVLYGQRLGKTLLQEYARAALEECDQGGEVTGASVDADRFAAFLVRLRERPEPATGARNRDALGAALAATAKPHEAALGTMAGGALAWMPEGD